MNHMFHLFHLFHLFFFLLQYLCIWYLWSLIHIFRVNHTAAAYTVALYISDLQVVTGKLNEWELMVPPKYTTSYMLPFSLSCWLFQSQDILRKGRPLRQVQRWRQEGLSCHWPGQERLHWGGGAEVRDSSWSSRSMMASTLFEAHWIHNEPKRSSDLLEVCGSDTDTKEAEIKSDVPKQEVLLWNLAYL